MRALTKTQIYAILYLKDINKLQVENIAQELNIDQDRLQKFLDNDYNTYTKNKAPTSKELMIRETSAKRNNSVAIMTKEASELNDRLKQTNKDSYIDSNPSVYRIK